MSSPLEAGKEAFLRAGGFAYLVEVLGVAQNSIWISFPDTTPPPPGTGVELDIDQGESFTRYHAHVAVSSPNSPGIMLERSESATHLKQRREFRVPYEVDIEVSDVSTGAITLARVIDLSEGGLRIASNDVYEVGARLVLTIEWPNDFDYPYPVRVLYARPPSVFHHTFGYGVRFDTLDVQAKTALMIFLSREISRRYPRELKALYPRSKRPARPKPPQSD